jgi:hypothetical protein
MVELLTQMTSDQVTVALGGELDPGLIRHALNKPFVGSLHLAAAEQRPVSTAALFGDAGIPIQAPSSEVACRAVPGEHASDHAEQPVLEIRTAVLDHTHRALVSYRASDRGAFAINE